MVEQQEVEARQRERERKREALEARILAMRKEFEAEDLESAKVIGQEMVRRQIASQDEQRMARSRRADAAESAETIPHKKPRRH